MLNAIKQRVSRAFSEVKQRAARVLGISAGVGVAASVPSANAAVAPIAVTDIQPVIDFIEGSAPTLLVLGMTALAIMALIAIVRWARAML